MSLHNIYLEYHLLSEFDDKRKDQSTSAMVIPTEKYIPEFFTESPFRLAMTVILSTWQLIRRKGITQRPSFPSNQRRLCIRTQDLHTSYGIVKMWTLKTVSFKNTLVSITLVFNKQVNFKTV